MTRRKTVAGAVAAVAVATGSVAVVSINDTASTPSGTAPYSNVQQQTVRLEDATTNFRAVTGIIGRAWLVGAITTGLTDGFIQVGLTDMEDVNTYVMALPVYDGRIEFYKVKGPPGGSSVEVT